MKETRLILNELLAKNFKDILKIEELILKGYEVSSNLTMPEIHTIESVADHAGELMSEIAKDLKITISTLSITINRLLEKGYISKVRQESDRRSVTLELTDKGKAVNKVHKKFHEEMISFVIDKMDTDEITTVIMFLEKINEFFIRKYRLEIGEE